MESVVKVLLQLSKELGKDYDGRDTPSKKELAAVVSRLEREGVCEDPRDILNPQKWDEITLLLESPEGREQWGGGRSSFVLGNEGTLTDWGKIRSSLIDEGRSLEVFPVVINNKGNPEWVPLDPKGITCLLDCVEKRSLNSPLTLNALEAMTSVGPLLPHNITNLMRIVLSPVQYTLWSSEWMTGLRAAIGAVESIPDHPLHESSLMRLVGMVRGMETPQRQVARLRPGELIAATDAMIQAFKRVAKGVEPVDPWTKMIQGPTESFSAFADRLLKAIQGSELLKSAQGPVIMDCLQQQSQLEVRELLRAAPQLSTPGEMIKYILDKQKAASLTNEGLAAAIVAAVGARQP
ncbi:uncharacterized protein LOC104917485 [Meleagris gallopavo]|uniref:uncharacterized protein LOC104917485 n=1 Tax=Meleagris gallopavo TaxID=9103 RepID=UPI00093C185A|nr:uncharacterized protein LOC104917485 [Meleagris gallopavo]